MTYRHLVYSILTSVKQRTDDSDISLSQILYWCVSCVNRVRSQILKKEHRNSGRFIQLFELTVFSDKFGKYADLPHFVHDMLNDGGVDSAWLYWKEDDCDPMRYRINYSVFSRLSTLKNNKYENPSIKNIVMVLEGKKLRLYGIECIDIEKIYAALYPEILISDICPLDTDVDVPQEYIEHIERTVLDIIFKILPIEQDKMNDGYDSVPEKTKNLPEQPQQAE